jgi:hypothetical protein
MGEPGNQPLQNTDGAVTRPVIAKDQPIAKRGDVFDGPSNMKVLVMDENNANDLRVTRRFISRDG